jgi:hypothetical protein
VRSHHHHGPFLRQSIPTHLLLLLLLLLLPLHLVVVVVLVMSLLRSLRHILQLVVVGNNVRSMLGLLSDKHRIWCMGRHKPTLLKKTAASHSSCWKSRLLVMRHLSALVLVTSMDPWVRDV